MRRKKIAIIDSGINANYIEFTDTNIQAISMIGKSTSDSTGHGTAVASEIVRCSENNVPDLLSIKVLDNKNQTNLKVLCDALNYCHSRSDISVINMSLAFKIDDMEIYQHLHSVFNLFAKKGIFVVCALPNALTTLSIKNPQYNISQYQKELMYRLPHTLHVMGHLCEQDGIQIHDRSISVSGVNRLCPSICNDYRFFNGNSIYAPRISYCASQLNMVSEADKLSWDKQLLEVFTNRVNTTAHIGTPNWNETIEKRLQEFKCSEITGEMLKQPDVFFENIQKYGFKAVLNLFGMSLPPDFDYMNITVHDVLFPAQLIARCVEIIEGYHNEED